MVDEGVVALRLAVALSCEDQYHGVEPLHCACSDSKAGVQRLVRYGKGWFKGHWNTFQQPLALTDADRVDNWGAVQPFFSANTPRRKMSLRSRKPKAWLPQPAQPHHNFSLALAGTKTEERNDVEVCDDADPPSWS